MAFTSTLLGSQSSFFSENVCLKPHPPYRVVFHTLKSLWKLCLPPRAVRVGRRVDKGGGERHRVAGHRNRPVLSWCLRNHNNKLRWRSAKTQPSLNATQRTLDFIGLAMGSERKLLKREVM